MAAETVYWVAQPTKKGDINIKIVSAHGNTGHSGLAGGQPVYSGGNATFYPESMELGVTNATGHYKVPDWSMREVADAWAEALDGTKITEIFFMTYEEDGYF